MAPQPSTASGTSGGTSDSALPSPQPSGSHPVIRFEQVPIVWGPLAALDRLRPKLLDDVVMDTMQEFSGSSVDLALGEARYAESVRLRRDPGNIFTRGRSKRDRALWSGVQAGLLRPPAEADRRRLLEHTIRHFAEEIGGRFDPRVYHFATRAVPWGMSWLLNAASVQRFMPWGMTQSLQSRLRITGEIPHLQSLAKRGTVLMVPTHQSNIDSILIGYIIYLMQLPPMAYGAGLNLFSNPVLSFFMSRLGAYTVDRRKSNEIYKATLKNYSTRILRSGIHSIFFPGGGRSRSGAIESRLKLGLLGTALDAELANLRDNKPNPRIFIVPMVMSYHFVLEAGSLIEDYLAEAGKHRFIIMDDESWEGAKVVRFFWRLFSSRSGITVRIGKPLDVFGNEVDPEGRSIGPNGTTIDATKLLSTRGELRAEPQRDREYTRELGARVVDRFHHENTVLTSHLAAFALFEALRKRYPELDLYRFLRLSLEQRSMPFSDFLVAAEAQHRRLRELAARGELQLCEELKTDDTEAWVRDGILHLGALHEVAVARVGDGAIWSEDLTLLYYYRNRLAGYGLSLLAERGASLPFRGTHDRKGFLA